MNVKLCHRPILTALWIRITTAIINPNFKSRPYIMTILHSNGYFFGKIPLKADFGDCKVILSSSESHKLANMKPFFYYGSQCHNKEWTTSGTFSVEPLSQMSGFDHISGNKFCVIIIQGRSFGDMDGKSNYFLNLNFYLLMQSGGQ